MAGERPVEKTTDPGAADRSVSQTLSRGITVLELLANASGPMSVQQIAVALKLKRPVVHRLVKTLESHQLVSCPTREGQYELGFGVLALSRTVRRDLRQAAYPIVKDLAERIGTTVVLALRDGDEIVYVLGVEAEQARMAVRSREGTRRPLHDSTSGLALRLTMPPDPSDDEELTRTRARGFAARDNAMGMRATAISAPVLVPGRSSHACVTALFPSVIDDIETVGPHLIAAAVKVARTVPLGREDYDL